MNYFAPFTLSVSIHIGLVLSFSNYFNINFNQFNIESIKPVAAYIVFEKKISVEKMVLPKKEVQLSKNKKIEKEKIEIYDASSVLKEIEKLENNETYITEELNKVLSFSEVEKYSLIIKNQVMENWKRPKNLDLKLRTEIQIDLVPTGEILSATVMIGSGNKVFDESAITAISRVANFEGLNMPIYLFDEHFRKFTLIFSPE